MVLIKKKSVKEASRKGCGDKHLGLRRLLVRVWDKWLGEKISALMLV